MFSFLQEHHYKVEAPDVNKVTQYEVDIPRADINKQTVSNYVRSNLTNAKDEIRAGDSGPDLKMLEDPAIKPIQVGDSKSLSTLSERKDLAKVEKGKLLSGLLQQYYGINKN